MIIRKHKKSDKILVCISSFICLFLSCNIGKELEVNRIIKGVFVNNVHGYTFCDEPNSIYSIGKDTIFICDISEYDRRGNLARFFVYKPEGVLEYSFYDLMKDTLLFQLTGGKSVTGWRLLDNNKIANHTDTLEVEMSKNNLGMNIFLHRKGNRVIIFE